ncbi:hypothetical protein N9O88_01690 [bacterium]|nr:hypothetical protein [bacterium]
MSPLPLYSQSDLNLSKFTRLNQMTYTATADNLTDAGKIYKAAAYAAVNGIDRTSSDLIGVQALHHIAFAIHESDFIKNIKFATTSTESALDNEGNYAAMEFSASELQYSWIAYGKREVTFDVRLTDMLTVGGNNKDVNSFYVQGDRSSYLSSPETSRGILSSVAGTTATAQEIGAAWNALALDLGYGTSLDDVPPGLLNRSAGVDDLRDSNADVDPDPEGSSLAFRIEIGDAVAMGMRTTLADRTENERKALYFNIDAIDDEMFISVVNRIGVLDHVCLDATMSKDSWDEIEAKQGKVAQFNADASSGLAPVTLVNHAVGLPGKYHPGVNDDGNTILGGGTDSDQDTTEASAALLSVSQVYGSSAAPLPEEIGWATNGEPTPSNDGSGVAAKITDNVVKEMIATLTDLSTFDGGPGPLPQMTEIHMQVSEKIHNLEFIGAVGNRGGADSSLANVAATQELEITIPFQTRSDDTTTSHDKTIRQEMTALLVITPGVQFVERFLSGSFSLTLDLTSVYGMNADGSIEVHEQLYALDADNVDANPTMIAYAKQAIVAKYAVTPPDDLASVTLPFDVSNGQYLLEVFDAANAEGKFLFKGSAVPRPGSLPTTGGVFTLTYCETQYDKATKFTTLMYGCVKGSTLELIGVTHQGENVLVHPMSIFGASWQQAQHEGLDTLMTELQFEGLMAQYLPNLVLDQRVGVKICGLDFTSAWQVKEDQSLVGVPIVIA